MNWLKNLFKKRETKIELLGQTDITHRWTFINQTISKERCRIYREYYVDSGKTKSVFACFGQEKLYYNKKIYDSCGELELERN